MTPEQKKTRLTVGAILAGGRGERLGCAVKAGITVGGTSLLRRVRKIVEPQCAHLVLSIGVHDDDRFEGAETLPMVSDSGNGPAVGLTKTANFVLSHYPQAQYLLSVAVDTPFFPQDFLARALELLGPQGEAVVSGYDGQVYPTNALWRLSSFAPEQSGKAQKPPRALFGLLDERRWNLLDYAGLTPNNPFTNINTPADLIACNRRVAEG